MGVRFWFSLLWMSLLLCSAATAVADDTPAIAPEELRTRLLKAENARKDGWTHALSLVGTGTWNQSSNVVGAPDGATLQLGLLLDGSVEQVSGQSTWTTTLKIQEAQAKTPVIDNFVKSSDSVDLVSTWLHRLDSLPWAGPYVRVRGATQLFKGELTKPADFTIKYSDSGLTSAHKGQQFARLTDPFDPLLFGEAVGLFANPTESDAVNVRAKIGVGSQQLYSAGGYTLADDAKTAEIEVKQMRSAVQVGAEAELALDGKVSAELKWKAKASFFLPVYTNIAQTQSRIASLNADLSAGASYKLSKWFSIDYLISAKRVPLIIDKWQVFSGLVLTAGFFL